MYTPSYTRVHIYVHAYVFGGLLNFWKKVLCEYYEGSKLFLPLFLHILSLSLSLIFMLAQTVTNMVNEILHLNKRHILLPNSRQKLSSK